MIVNFFQKYFLTILFLFIVTAVYAQAGDPGGDPDVPIDGGLSLLAAAGIGYGTKKIIDHRKNQKKEEE